MIGYKLEAGGEYQGKREFKPGDLMAADVYTDSLPSGLPIESYVVKPVRYRPGLDRGYFVRGLIEFQLLGLALYKRDPEEILEEIKELGIHFNDQGISADAQFNVLRHLESVAVPSQHLERKGGLKLLVPYNSFQPVIARLKLL